MNKSKRGVYNPMTKDFTVKFDVSGKGKPETFKIGAGEIEYFEVHIADHAIKHLAKEIFNSRDKRKSNYVDDIEEIKKDITVDTVFN